MEWSKRTTLDLIELLQMQECLWNVKHETYKDRQKKKDALTVIALQMGIDVGDVDKKIMNLKNQFNRELIKMKTKSGIDDVYVSPWYAFKPLGFLRNNNLPKPHRSSDSITEDQNDSVSNMLNAPFIEDHDIPCVLKISDVSSITEKKGVKRVKSSDNRHKEVLSLLKDAHDNISKHSARDEFDVFGEYVAIELRGVIDKRNILQLKKQIQDLIYSTKLNEINYESKKVFEQTLTAPGDGRPNQGIYTQPGICTDDITWIKDEP